MTARGSVALERCPRCRDVSAFRVKATGLWVCLTCGVLEPWYQEAPPAAPGGRWPHVIR